LVSILFFLLGLQYGFRLILNDVECQGGVADC